MKRMTLIGLTLLLTLALCLPALADVAKINVTSTSITAEGKLLTITANKHKQNNPNGKNKSPQLTWNQVEGAKFYAVVMYDTDANWLHWYKSGIKAKKGETMSLKQGAFSKKGVYVGPYPPSGTGTHHYRIEVFALAKKPASFKVKMNSNVTRYDQIVAGLDKAKGMPSGNILGRGTLVGTYAHGDNTK